MESNRSPRTRTTARAVTVAMLTLCLAGVVPGAVQAAKTRAADSKSLEEIVVSATRSQTPASRLTRSVTVIHSAEIREQVGLDRNLGSILAQTVPGLSPSTEAASNFGQTLRGRNFLVLIDGIPQSTPLRDGYRDLNTISPAAIKRIEVVRGGTAQYGFGAAGGLVNIITREPSKEPGAGFTRVGASVNTEETDNSGEYSITQRLSGTRNRLDGLVLGHFTRRNGRFDARGRRIPPDPLGAQGGLADTDEYDLLGKLGYEPAGGDQRIEMMVNDFRMQQETDYIFGSVSSLGNDPLPNSRRTPAVRESRAVPGSTNIVDPGTDSTTANLRYRHADLLGSRLKLSTYYGDQRVTFSNFPGTQQFFIDSEKLGSRLTVVSPVPASSMQVTWGLDTNHDETRQGYHGANEPSPLRMDQNAYAGFGQLEWPLADQGVIRAGLRHEVISVDVAELQRNRFGNRIRGGTLDYNETLFNLSGALFITDQSELFASFAQGFSLSDIGGVINTAGSLGTREVLRAEQFETDAEKVDSYELGVRGRHGDTRFTLAAFYSTSDNGATFDSNEKLLKNEERIHGVEAELDYRINRHWKAGGTAAWSEGSQDTASGERDLPNTRIPPEKVTAYLEYNHSRDWRNRLQLRYVGHRAPDTTVFGAGEINPYTLVNFTSRLALGPGAVRLSLENLLNRDYYPAINQAYDTPFGYAKGPGRRLGLSYEMDW